MVVKFYVSMISGNKEMKKRQIKAQLIMESKGVDFQIIDIADPNSESDRLFMQKNAVPKKGARNAVPPQFFNNDQYCGDYDGFDEANENDSLEEFLKLPKGSLPIIPVINHQHSLSNLSSRDTSMEKEIGDTQLSNGGTQPDDRHEDRDDQVYESFGGGGVAAVEGDDARHERVAEQDQNLLTSTDEQSDNEVETEAEVNIEAEIEDGAEAPATKFATSIDDDVDDADSASGESEEEPEGIEEEPTLPREDGEA